MRKKIIGACLSGIYGCGALYAIFDGVNSHNTFETTIGLTAAALAVIAAGVQTLYKY